MGWCTSAIVTFASACRGLCLCAVRGRLTVAKDGHDSIPGACIGPRVLKNIIFTVFLHGSTICYARMLQD